MEATFDPTKFTIQTFNDSEQERGELAQIFSFEPQRIKELQKQGAGVYFAINPQEDPNQRGIENTKEFKGIGLDWDVCKEEDQLPKEEIVKRKAKKLGEIEALAILPNWLIESKNGYQGLYIWDKAIPLETVEARNAANEDYKDLLRGFGKVTGLPSEGDNISRAMRLPGTFHLKNPNDPFKITCIQLNPTPVNFEKFKETSPPIAKPVVLAQSSVKNNDTDPVFEQILKYPVKEALEKLSGKEAVDYEVFSFRENSDGTVQIIIDGTATSQWIDIPNNTIGGGGAGQGNPTIIQFVQWYGINRRKEDAREAKGKAIRALKEILGMSSVSPYREQPATQHNQLQKSNVSQISDEDLQQLVKADRIEDLATESGDLEIEWYWDGYIGRGLKTELSAFWKAGKTTLIIELLKCLVSGQPFVGRQTKPIKVFLISEESKIAWIDRRTKKGLKGFEIKCKPFKRKVNRAEWERYLEKLATYCKENKFDLVIFDTISDFWPIFKEEDPVDVKDALRPMNYLLEAGLGTLVVHHFSRKGAREGGAGRGSGALPSDMDIVIDFMRFAPDNDHDTRRILKGGNSRFEETPRELVIELTNSGYTAIGDSKSEVFKEENLATLCEILPESPNSVTVKELIEGWQGESKAPNKGTFSRWLNELEKRKLAQRTKPGGNKPDQWNRSVVATPSNNATSPKNEPASVALQTVSSTDATQNLKEQNISFDNDVLQKNHIAIIGNSAKTGKPVLVKFPNLGESSEQ